MAIIDRELYQIEQLAELQTYETLLVGSRYDPTQRELIPQI